jgi:Spy/CpxP family protein refolding chaperone
MRISRLALISLLFAMVGSLSLWGQDSAPHPGTAFGEMGMGPGPGPGAQRMVIRREMGKWWQNSEVAKKLQLNDGQITQLNQIFYEHRLKLIDYEADMQKQDLKLQTMLDADQPDEGQVGGQVDQLLAARGKLEREFTFMNLDLRKVLSLDQWRQLKSIQGNPGPDVFFYKKLRTGGSGGGEPPLAPLPPLPPSPDDRY